MLIKTKNLPHFKFVFCVVCLLTSGVLTSCVTRAPSKYELDMQAGRFPKHKGQKLEKKITENIEQIKKINTNQKPSNEPVLLVPRIEKVWVYDQELNDILYFQGTYVYLRIDNGRWLGTGQ